MKKIIYCACLLGLITLNVYSLQPGPLNPTDPPITVPPSPTQLQGHFHSYMIDNGYLVVILGPRLYETGPYYAGKIKIDGSRLVEYIMARLVITNAREWVHMFTPALPPTLKFITHSDYISGKDVKVADLNIVGVKFTSEFGFGIGYVFDNTSNNLNSISFFEEVVTPPQVPRTIFNVNIGIVQEEYPAELKVTGMGDYSFVFQETAEFDYMVGQFVQFLQTIEYFPAIIYPVPFSGTNISGFRFQWTAGLGNRKDIPTPASRSFGFQNF